MAKYRLRARRSRNRGSRSRLARDFPRLSTNFADQLLGDLTTSTGLWRILVDSRDRLAFREIRLAFRECRARLVIQSKFAIPQRSS